MIGEGPSHALVTIHFVRIQTNEHPDRWSADRYWYHVPSQGDYIDLGGGTDGQVKTVFWGDDHVTVRFR